MLASPNPLFWVKTCLRKIPCKKSLNSPSKNTINFFQRIENMPIYTTYLGFLNKHGGPNKVAQKLGSCFVYYVMRNRGNNEVAPSETLLMFMKSANPPSWETYEKFYKKWLSTPAACSWMEKRAQEAKIGNILLVCYEGPRFGKHCHRFLLAEEIARRFGAEYKGEVSFWVK